MEFKSYSRNSKNALLVFFMILLATASEAYACQVMVNDSYQKNLLVAQAANELDLSLAGMSSTVLTGYSRTLEGNGPYECPLFIVTQAKVSFEYSPKKNKNCSASATITYRQYIGEITPELDVPLYEATLSGAEQACSTSGVFTRIPVKFPPVIRKPVIIKPLN